MSADAVSCWLSNSGYMQKIPALIGVAVLCLALQICRGQTADTVSGRLLNKPSRFFSKLQSEMSGLNNDLGSQTRKYLLRLARKEQKLKAGLYQLDSARAAKLYAQDPQQQYQALLQKLRADSAIVFHSMGPEYLPMPTRCKACSDF